MTHGIYLGPETFFLYGFGVQIRLLVTLEGKVINFGQFWSDPSMQEEFAEPALYVKSGYLEVSIFFARCTLDLFHTLDHMVFPTGTQKGRIHTKALSRELH